MMTFNSGTTQTTVNIPMEPTVRTFFNASVRVAREERKALNIDFEKIKSAVF